MTATNGSMERAVRELTAQVDDAGDSPTTMPCHEE
jgi:hypothetical protein